MNFDKATLTWTLVWDADWVSAVSFIGNSRRLAAGNNLGEILVWDLPEKPPEPMPEPKADAKDAKSAVKSAAAKPAKTATSKELGANALPVRRLDGHSNVVSKLLSPSDGRWLISASYDHTIRTWDMAAQASEQAEVVVNARAIAEASSESGRRAGRKIPPPIAAKVVVQTSARTLGRGSESTTTKAADSTRTVGHQEWVTGLTISRDEKLLLSGDDGGHAILWDRAAGTEQKRFRLKGWAYAVALSPDNKQALISERIPLVFDSGQRNAVQLWDVATGQPKLDLSKDFKMYIGAAAFSPDGKHLVLGRGGEAEGQLFVLDAASGKKLRELTPKHESGVTDMAFHPEGQHLATSGRDTVVRIWDVAAGKLVKELGKPRGGQFKDWIHAVSFSADGKLLAGADMAGYVHVWSLGS